jgi:hypothetical protein
MGPIVTEVEDIDELLARLETGKPQDALVENMLFVVRFGLHDSYASAVAELEFMQV